eukprot:scaffold5138_cov251-Pinguiococcus_pyrenoidosus.AAC.11
MQVPLHEILPRQRTTAGKVIHLLENQQILVFDLRPRPGPEQVPRGLEPEAIGQFRPELFGGRGDSHGVILRAEVCVASLEGVRDGIEDLDALCSRNAIVESTTAPVVEADFRRSMFVLELEHV